MSFLAPESTDDPKRVEVEEETVDQCYHFKLLVCAVIVFASLSICFVKIMENFDCRYPKTCLVEYTLFDETTEEEFYQAIQNKYRICTASRNIRTCTPQDYALPTLVFVSIVALLFLFDEAIGATKKSKERKYIQLSDYHSLA
jgi:hypothetical protein